MEYVDVKGVQKSLLPIQRNGIDFLSFASFAIVFPFEFSTLYFRPGFKVVFVILFKIDFYSITLVHLAAAAVQFYGFSVEGRFHLTLSYFCLLHGFSTLFS